MNAAKKRTSTTFHPWSREALFAKAQRYAEEMLTQTRGEWKFALWSTLVLELLGRAALANISPALLADTKDWNHLYYSLGFSPTAKKFVPKSIDVSSVFNRLQIAIPEFTPELEGFAVFHMVRRNEELHAGSLPFDNLGSAEWLAQYYQTCTVLLKSMDESLDVLFGDAESEVATHLIAAASDSSAKAVFKDVAAHKAHWENLPLADRRKASRKAAVWSTRQEGHRVSCPACDSEAIVTGSAIAPPLRRLDGEEITETQLYLPSKFECIACGLKVAGLSKLTACGLGNTFNATSTYDLSEFYSPDEYDGYEPDYNE